MAKKKRPAGALSRQKTYTVEILGRRILVKDMVEASDVVSAIIDRSGMGASEIGAQFLVRDDVDEVIGYVSYNGRVWKGPPSDSKRDALAFDPSSSPRTLPNPGRASKVFSAVLRYARKQWSFLPKVRFRYCPMADDEHRRSFRQFAHTSHVEGAVCFARAADKDATVAELVGLSAHELGHVAAEALGWPAHRKRIKAGKTPAAVQREADRASKRILGIPLRYNKRKIEVPVHRFKIA